MKYSLERTTIQHILQVLPEIIQENPNLIDDKFRISDIAAIINASLGLSLFYDNEFICAGGILPDYPGVGNIWMYWTPRLKRHVREAVKVAKEQIDLGMDKLGLHRLESMVEYNNKIHYRFNQFAGFELETERCRKKCPRGKDYHMFVKIKED